MALQQPDHPLHRREFLPPRDREGVERMFVEDAAKPPLQKFRSGGGLVGRGQEGIAVPLQLAPDGGGGGRVAEVGLRKRPGDRGEPVLEADLGATVVAHCCEVYRSGVVIEVGQESETFNAFWQQRPFETERVRDLRACCSSETE